MIVEKIVNTTYGALEQALLALGFERSTGTNNFGFPYIAYMNRECEALICLPDRPKNELMYGGHYIVAEKTVEGRGVADLVTLHRQHREAGQAQVA